MNTDLKLFDESEKPDVKESAIQSMIDMAKNTDLATLEKLQGFQVLLNQNPPQQWIKQHNYLTVKRGEKWVPYEYLPVERTELLLTRMYFGQWSTVNYKWTQVFNEIAGSIELELIDPMTGRLIKRTGAAAIQIMQDKDAKVHQFNETKKPNALETGFPKLKAECFKNAAKSLGNLFGANVGRDTDGMIYIPLINEKNRHQIMEGLLESAS